jgi:hypothetical protein
LSVWNSGPEWASSDFRATAPKALSDSLAKGLGVFELEYVG